MDKDTAKTTEQLHEMNQALVADEVGDRVAAWLRNLFPVHTAKEAARLFNCPPRTVEGWLQGQMPQNKHMLQMMAAWGKGFVAFVYEPAVGTPMAAYQLETELQDLKAKLKCLEGNLDAANFSEVRTMADAPVVADRITRGQTR